MTHSQPIPAGFGKRLLAITYDVLIIFFITFVLTLILQQLIIQLELIDLDLVQINKEGDKIPMIPLESPLTLFFRVLWLIVSIAYLIYYWTKRGQTPGMRVWKIKVVRQDGSLPGFTDATLRYAFALFGLGLLWVVFNKNHLALQDVMSKTRLIKTA